VQQSGACADVQSADILKKKQNTIQLSSVLTTLHVDGRMIAEGYIRQYAVLCLHFCVLHRVDIPESHTYSCIMLIFYVMSCSLILCNCILFTFI